MATQRILLAFATNAVEPTTRAIYHLGRALGELTGIKNFEVSIDCRDGVAHYELLFEMATGHRWSDVEHAVLGALISSLGLSESDICDLITAPTVCTTPSSSDDHVRAFDLDRPLASTAYHGRPDQFAALDPAAQDLVRQLRRTIDIEDLHLEVIDAGSAQPYRLLIRRHSARSWQHVNQIVLAALAAHYHCFTRQLERRSATLPAAELTFHA